MTADQDSDEFELEFDEFDETDEEFREFIEALGLPDRLPPLWLPDLPDLAAAARESALLRRAAELAAWVGERREVTEEGDLIPSDAAEAAERLGVGLADLLVAWETALAADLVVVTDDGTADANPDLWPTDDDEEDIGTWALAFTQALQSLVFDAELAGEEELDFDSAATLVLPMFLARGLGVPVAELQEITRDMATEDLESDAPWQAWVAEHGDPVTALLDRLGEHGAVEIDGENARLTPLGLLVMREELVDGGIDVPLLPDLEELTAADLLTVVGGWSAEELSALSDSWLATRDADAAATELLAAAVAAEPAGRFYASSILAKLPSVPWASVLAEPALRPYARDALGQDQEPADTAWLLFDALSASANAVGELNPEVVEVAVTETLVAGREEEILTGSWRLRHPAAFEALSLVGAHHPDKKLAKAARTAAHKAQSVS